MTGGIGLWLGGLTLLAVYTLLSFLYIAGAMLTPAIVERIRLARPRRLGPFLALAADLPRVQPSLRLGRLACLMLLMGLASVRGLPLLDEWLRDAVWKGWRLWVFAGALLLTSLLFSAISFLLGEILPRRSLGTSGPRLLLIVAPWLRLYVRLLSPLVALLEGVATVFLRLFGLKETAAPKVSREEIESLVDLGTAEGLLEPVEKHLLKETLRLSDRTVRQIMRPKVDLDAADVDTPPEEILGVVAMAGYSRLPVYKGSLDGILGYVHTKDVLRQFHMGWSVDLRKLARPALFVPETMTLDRLLVLFREKRDQLAIVVDEYGATEGMVTLEDVIDELVGGLDPGANVLDDPGLVAREDGSWLVDGQMSLAEFLDAIRAESLVAEAPKTVTSVAGLILEQLGHLPSTGEKTEWQGLSLEVVDMDKQRIDRVLVHWTL